MIPRLSPEEAHAKIAREGFAYVDVRSEDDFEEGHPAGAYNVPFGQDFVRVVASCFARDAKIVVGCRTGIQSTKAARALVDAGFTNVVEQRAGWNGVKSPFGQTLEKGWRALGLPSDEGYPAGRAYADLLQRLARS
jgi:rhodanese-related sulfurtransferase